MVEVLGGALEAGGGKYTHTHKIPSSGDFNSRAAASLSAILSMRGLNGQLPRHISAKVVTISSVFTHLMFETSLKSRMLRLFPANGASN